MIALFDMWCAYTTRTRCACWCVWSLSLYVLVIICLSATEKTGHDELLRQRVSLREQWQSLRQWVIPVDDDLMAADNATRPFSPLHFQLAHARLLHWKPDARGGEMALTARWEAVPQIFARLAEQGMAVNQFSLSVENAELVLTLHLERTNDG